MRVLVTRPRAQAREWVLRLAEQGIEATALPLIEIQPPADPRAVQAVWRSLASRTLLVFVSPNAAAQFFAQRPPDCNWPTSLRAAAPGPGSSAALREAGVPAAAIVEPAIDGGRFDSEALWAVLQSHGPWGGASVLIVRGSVEGEPQGSGREWLSQTLTAAGAAVEFVAAYRRGAPRLDAAEQAVWAQALAAPDMHLWLFSSSEAIDQLERLAAEHALQRPWTVAQALATHPRIAERARTAGFARVLEASPTLAAIVAAIEAAQTRPIESDAP
ncbi:uroporphyrinogen-III synthase [Methylibium sp.]|uniref:uroporphyrinogen-III synthase n=1 Tax=Methylibium sp. TaxID=2067992 RepID=UPI0025E2429E|nr:uroporphyrinogen-III synthase [Methylibium sp.]